MFQVSKQRTLALDLAILEVLRAAFLLGYAKGEGKNSSDSTDDEFERRHGNAGWFENERPERKRTRMERIMLWFGFEKD
jgi:hypothetical protein